VPSYASSIIGFFFGFGFGVGCALAVMYSIYMGGYRAAVREAAAPVPSERLLKERKRLKLDPPA
jgi:Na+-driven multidrug efflux pump